MSSDYLPLDSDTDVTASPAITGTSTGTSGHADSPAPSPLPPDDSQPAGFWPVLQNRNFLVLWIGQVFSQLADKVYLVLMIAIIANRFQTSDQSISAWVSALMITFTIPAVLFGFLAGVFVDRWPKKAVLVISNLLRGLLVIALPLIFLLTQGLGAIASIPIGFLILLAVTFLVSTLTQFFAPAEQSAIPLIVPRHHLLSANSLYTTTMMASVIVGFALGEPVLALADTLMLQINSNFDAYVLETGKELLVGSGYGIAGLILILIQTQEGRSSQTANNSADSPHLWRDMQDGLRFLNQSPSVRAALLQLIILFSIVAALAVLAVRLAEVIPVLEADQFGFLLAAGGVGMALGAALLGQFGHRLSHLQLTLMGGAGLALCLISLAAVPQQLIPSLLCIGGVGLFTACIGIPMQTTIQAETPEAMRGKVFGLQNNAVNIALSLPLAIAGIAETLLGLPTVLIGLSGLVITGSLLTWYSASKVSAKA
ncbi:MAG: MFS transporter [Cyanothece sp. SIO2G6]|nr:MFS transporter [Cyanothece sp. SIO2G6]